MSTQCNRFVQNAWKKELCSNCFKPREEHTPVEETLRLSIGRASSNLKTDNLKLQSILRVRASYQKEQRKKNVAFPESLTEVIGYGGDDFFSDTEEEGEQGFVESLNSEDETAPDSEEERALGNLTRANTNFNTITANLTEIVLANDVGKSNGGGTTASRSFASLMLGRIQKDADGRKTTLLVSVTPFGGDESLPTAKRPSDRKIVNGFASSARCKTGDSLADSKTEKTPKKTDVDQKKLTKDQKSTAASPSGLEKIVDMPLITSTNLISVMQRTEAPSETNDSENGEKTNSALDALQTKSEKKIAAISRSPAIKKSENEKPKIVQAGQNASRTECDLTRNAKRSSDFSRVDDDQTTSMEKGIELTLTPLTKTDVDEAAESDRPMIVRGKDINKIAVAGKEKETKPDSSPLEVRQVEGENVADEKKFSCEESRESVGEPDGKADEAEVGEPPELPRSPPPPVTEIRPPTQGEQTNKPLITTEPRVSFLHGGIHGESRSKPLIPQKPMAFSGKSGASATENSGLGKKSGYVLPPPSVQNAGSRTVQGAGGTTQDTHSNSPRPKERPEQSHDSSMESMESPKTDNCQESQVPRAQNLSKATYSFDLKTDISKTSFASYKIKPPPLNLSNTTESRDVENLEVEEDSLDVQPGSTAELIRSPNKRRMAPRPPASDANEDLPPASSLFARNPGANLKSDSPVVREKEKRERASSCSPKFRKAVCPDLPEQNAMQSAESASRRTISLSQDSLTNGPEVREEKKRGRSRFSLKRFLRMGSRKDVDMTGGQNNARIDEIPSTPQPKPRLEIIHPLELDGAAVEVVGNDRISGRVGEDQTDSCGSRSDVKTTRSGGGLQHTAVRPGKPPPPPRNQSLEDWSRLDPANKPVRPPPPRVEAKQLPPRSEKTSSKSASSWQPATSTTSDSIYANLAAEDVTGEVRSALAPSKPQRTASMRDQAMSQPIFKKHGIQTEKTPRSQDYEALPVISPPISDSPTSNDSHVYECLSSSPECDSNLELRHGGGSHLTCKRKSDSSAMETGVEFKFHHQPFVRSTSLPYCGSETESELYAPYSFYTGDEGPEEDQDWKNKDDEIRISRLRQRRGRSIVHRSLEDNYGAVVIANHEALAQFLEQLNQTPQIPAGLRSLKNANPRLVHFSIDPSTIVSVGRRIFYSALWNEQNVTLCIAFDLAMHVSRKEFYLAPIIEFIDSVPREIACLPGNKDTEATISVLPRLHVSTIQSFGAMTKDARDEGSTREASFVLLQFVNALKSLQARGIEEASKSLSNVVLCREDKDACYRLYLLQGRLNIDTNDERNEERVSLCQCALIALQQLYLTTRLPLIQELLMREKAVTLSQVKSILEFSLWGPADVTLGGPREREVTLQRWLDLERATVLHALVRTRAPLTVTDEYQLLFLVRTSAKIICEASMLLDEQRNRLARAC